MALTMDRGPGRQVLSGIDLPGDAGESCADGLAALAASVADNIDRIQRSAGDDVIHQLRVSISRLSTALRIRGRRRLHLRRRRLRRELRWLRRRLAGARDWDVFAAHHSIRDTAVSDYDPLLAIAAHERMVGRDRIALAVRSRRCFDLTDALRRLEQAAADAERTAPTSDLPGAITAARLLERQLRKILRNSSHPASLSPRALHKLRARIRRLRYSCEYLGPLFRTDNSVYLKILAELQKTLGQYNDSYVVHGLAQAAAALLDAARVEAITASHRSETDALGRKLRKEIARLRRLTPYWALGAGRNEPLRLAET
jgi:CHAD domain-containing protein